MIRLRKQYRAVPVICVVLLQSAHAFAEENAAKFEIYGFAQADYIQDFRRVDPAWEDTLRPSKIPTTSGQFGSDGQAAISVRQSRFGANSEVPIQNQSLKTKFEFDMFGVGTEAGKTTIRLRHAYGQWGQWLGGQTHSLFMDIDVFPNVIDYWGPAGLVFLRNPQIRWTPIDGLTSFAVAIEKPTDDLDPGQIREVDPSFGPNIQADEKLPDLTAQIRKTGEWGHAQLGGILRRIGYDTLSTQGNSPKGFKVGWGFDLTGHLNLRERDKLILSGTYGQGIASYMNDGGTDLAPEINSGAIGPKAVPLWGMAAYYDLYWTDQWASTFGYSRTQVENTNFQSGSSFFRGEYASVNLLYSPIKSVMMGAEVLWGRRTDNSDATGNDIRSQISFRYNFSSNAKAEGA